MDTASTFHQLKMTLKRVSGPQCSTAARCALCVTGSADDLSRYGVPLNAQVRIVIYISERSIFPPLYILLQGRTQCSISAALLCVLKEIFCSES